ncbi:S1/P1 nuclease [Saccharospirillum salsuginis]|uniref:Endonuclease n=1 Tax=Saccharospirillum salsuginis TaxID=418750 RepID=A0A918KLG4_9GAMM|nr:S1/P1 nuclease [Saccharospirillum salsuginis]GGX67800.1 endonuclease [Saccharospirillum salsuginis]
MAGRTPQSARLILFVLALGLGGLAQAFTEPGYKVPIQLAQFHLTEAARAGLAGLYGEQWAREMIQLSDWAKAQRPSRGLRVVLFDADDTGFDVAKHCPNNGCVVGAVMESHHVLSRDGFSDDQKRQAVQYLMHFITELHIPVNAGLKSDQGGRLVWLRDSELNRVHLSEVWNDRLYDRLPGTWFSQAQRLERDLTDETLREWTASVRPVDWAWETHQLALDEAYPMAGRGQYDAIFVREALPLLERQLTKSGLRLAALLNAAFAPQPAEGSTE